MCGGRWGWGILSCLPPRSWCFRLLTQTFLLSFHVDIDFVLLLLFLLLVFIFSVLPWFFFKTHVPHDLLHSLDASLLFSFLLLKHIGLRDGSEALLRHWEWKSSRLEIGPVETNGANARYVDLLVSCPPFTWDGMEWEFYWLVLNWYFTYLTFFYLPLICFLRWSPFLGDGLMVGGVRFSSLMMTLSLSHKLHDLYFWCCFGAAFIPVALFDLHLGLRRYWYDDMSGYALRSLNKRR